MGEAVEDSLPFGNECAHISRLGLLQQRLQIRAGDEDRLFCRSDNQTTQRGVILNEIEMFI